jgi:hypothetical protein
MSKYNIVQQNRREWSTDTNRNNVLCPVC